VKFIGHGARVLGSKYQIWSKTYQNLPKAYKLLYKIPEVCILTV
jgi:hypothetical protein